LSLIVDSLFFGLIVLLMIVGLIGVIVPILPGIFMIWLGVAVYVWRDNFETLSIATFLFISFIVIFAGLSDIWLPIFGARKVGAAKRTILTGLIGAIIGSFIVPIIGTIIGYAVGVLLGEYHKRRDWDAAWRASKGGLAGWGIATIIQLVGGVLVIIIFIWAVLVG
jgi:uncharacterized protein YqgC (DUF456 family)